jgi:pantoate--beta-alanine ligase
MTQTVQDRQAAGTHIAKWRDNGLTSCLVPTMGGIHDGHLALMDRARTVADKVIVSIYVNPTQFAASEDFDSYPRELEADLARIGQRADIVYAPANLYHHLHATQVNPAGAALGLESEFRPHFFTGVATIVLKLLNQLPTDFAIFGQKDFQQLVVVRQLVRDLDVPVEILDHPTVRGLTALPSHHATFTYPPIIAPLRRNSLRLFAQQHKSCKREQDPNSFG